MKRFYVLLLILFLVSFASVQAIIVEPNVTFINVDYNYTSNSTSNVDTIILQNQNFVLNGLTFCDSAFVNFFTATETCAAALTELQTSLQNAEGKFFQSLIFMFSIVGIIIIALIGVFLIMVLSGNLQFDFKEIDSVAFLGFIIVSVVISAIMIYMFTTLG